jgi:hypothetical protein
LRREGVVFTEAPRVASNGNACQVREPVALVSVPDAGGRSIRFDGTPIIDCSLAKPLAVWTREIAAPVLTQSLGSQVSRLRDVGGYECRNRNGDGSGKVSAHAEGLAIDLGAFEMSDGTIVSVVPGRLPRADAAIAALRQAACGWFLTVLGPGTDPAHATHLHLDVQQHGSSDRYRICQ